MKCEEIQIMKMLGDYVKFQRTKKGLTQKELAERVKEQGFPGINSLYISRIERHDLPGITISNLGKILSVLESTVVFQEIKPQ